MSLLQAIVLGIVQGLTEFVPISSSAHLVIVPWLFGWNDPGLSFDVALHMGTLVALIIFFWRDWVHMFRVAGVAVAKRDLSIDPDARLLGLIILATIPGGIAGALGESRISDMFHAVNPSALEILTIAFLMCALGVLLWVGERVARHREEMQELTLGKALVIGFAQMLALLPGVSRSGSTITAGLFMGLKRDAAARFSFMLATPIVAGAGLLKLYDLKKNGLPSGERVDFLAGFLVAAIVGYLCIKWLLSFLQRNRTDAFVYYRVALSIMIVAVFALRAVLG